MNPIPVVVVGDVMLDMCCRLAAPITPGDDTPARITGHAGGAGANTAAGLARLGVPVRLIARVGDDEAGRAADAELTGLGVTCRFAIDPARSTGRVIVLVDPDGERTMLSDRAANAGLRPGDVALPTRPGHLHLSGYVLLDGRSRPAGLAALAAARDAGWTTSVDPQTAAGITAAGADRFLGWVDGIDLLLPNETECVALGGPARLLAAARSAAVTYGAGGARWYARSGDRHVRLDRSVDASGTGTGLKDSTGAGDAFNAGFLTAWLNGAEPERALAAGVAAGTSVADRRGARTSD